MKYTLFGDVCTVKYPTYHGQGWGGVRILLQRIAVSRVTFVTGKYRASCRERGENRADLADLARARARVDGGEFSPPPWVVPPLSHHHLARSV